MEKKTALQVKAGIDASGYRTAVKDYTELTVVEELAANSYDADATNCVVLLDTNKNLLHIVDDGLGFSKEAIERLAILGGGSKQNILYSVGNRHYLGSYGYGLTSSLNIADRVVVTTISEDGKFEGTLDWTKLDEALKPSFSGFDFDHQKHGAQQTGTHLVLKLKNPTSRDQLDKFAGVLANLPTDKGKFSCYVGPYDEVLKSVRDFTANFFRAKQQCPIVEEQGFAKTCIYLYRS